MDKYLALSFLFTTTLAVSGCNKPSKENCRRAVDNIIRLTAAGADAQTDRPKAVRSCRGSSTKESVKCVIEAETLEALNQCGGDLADNYVKPAAKESLPPPKPDSPSTPPNAP